MPLPPTPFPMPSNSGLTMHLEQDTTLPSPTRGPHKPLQLTIPPLSPPPAGHPLSPVQAPHSSPTRELEPEDTLSKTQAKKEMGGGEGLQAGSPECLLCNKGSSRELESPWPPCCARKPGTSEWASRAELSGRARAPPPRPRPSSRSAALRAPLCKWSGVGGAGRWAQRPRQRGSWPRVCPPAARMSVHTCQAEDWSASHGIPKRRTVAHSRVTARKAPGFLRPVSGCGFGHRLRQSLKRTLGA